MEDSFGPVVVGEWSLATEYVRKHDVFVFDCLRFTNENCISFVSLFELCYLFNAKQLCYVAKWIQRQSKWIPYASM